MQLLTQPMRFPFYLWIVSVYPILHLYAANFGMVLEHQVALSVAVMLIAATLAYLAAIPFIANPHKIAFYLSIVSLYFSTSGHLYSIFVLPKSLLLWNIASAIVLAAIASAFIRFIPLRSYAQFTTPFNLIAAAFLVLQIITLLADSVAADRYVDANSAFYKARENRPSAEKVMDSPVRPDIYYIIPDGYPSNERLLKDMNFDNSEFTEALRERGFVIAHHAQSNYSSTHHSLATILNMQFFTQNPSELNDLDYLRISIVNSKVAQELLRLGYTYVQFVSGYVLPSPIADINRDFALSGPFDISTENTVVSPTRLQDRQTQRITDIDDKVLFRQPFLPIYIDTTSLRIVRSQLEKLRLSEEYTPYTGKAAQRFLDTVDEVETIVAMPEATFTIIHLMQPHRPVNFNEAGEIIEQIAQPSLEDFYADLRFSNSQFLRMIDTILQNSASEPVIIFQSDHGSDYRKDIPERPFVLFDVFAAYYVPSMFDLAIPKPYTLVNSFALILNQVIDTVFDLQKDKLFELPKGNGAPFEQVDVTEDFLHR